MSYYGGIDETSGKLLNTNAGNKWSPFISATNFDSRNWYSLNSNYQGYLDYEPTVIDPLTPNTNNGA